MHGLLIVDKPAGIGSTDVLRRLRRVLGRPKLGHGGTLDPFATGLLPVFLGEATRLTPFLHGVDKGYRAVLELGVATDTLDLEGQVTDRQPVDPELDEAKIEACLRGFVGRIEQRVPAFSAVHVDGERLHRKARRGEIVERPLREVLIRSLTLRSWAAPWLEFDVACSAGTYVRSLGEDIAAALGTVGHLHSLRRLSVGPFHADRALALEGADRAAIEAALVPIEDALPHLPLLTLDEVEVLRVRQGQKLGATRVPEGAVEGDWLRMVDAQGVLIAVAEVLPEARGLKVARGLPVLDLPRSPDSSAQDAGETENPIDEAGTPAYDSCPAEGPGQ